MKNLTAKGIEKYLVSNHGLCRHDPNKLKIASQLTAKRFEVSPIELFKFIVDGDPIKSLHVVSYGFHTALGREIVREFEFNYYNI